MTPFDLNRLLVDGKKLMEDGVYDKAVSLFEEVLAIDIENVEAYFSLGNIYHVKGQLGKAVKSFNKVLEFNSEHTDAAISLSVILNDIGKYEEAQKVFEKANSKIQNSNTSGVEDPHINKKFALKHFELAEMYQSYNRFEESLFEYGKSIELDPGMLEARVKMAKIYSKKGFQAKAFETLIKLKNDEPDYILGRTALGLLHYSKGNTLEAQSEWEVALKKDPQNEELKMYLKLSRSATETNLTQI